MSLVNTIKNPFLGNRISRAGLHTEQLISVDLFISTAQNGLKTITAKKGEDRILFVLSEEDRLHVIKMLQDVPENSND